MITALGGVLAITLLSDKLDKEKCYAKVLRFVSCGSLVFTILFYLSMPLHFGITYVVLFFLGFFSVPIMAVCFKFCAEVSSPVSVALSNGFMDVIATSIYIISLNVIPMVIKSTESSLRYGALIFVGMAVVSVIPALSLKDKTGGPDDARKTAAEPDVEKASDREPSV